MMSIAKRSPSALLHPEDLIFLERLRQMHQSVGDFVLAQLFKGQTQIAQCAAQVLLYREHRFISVETLFEECARHNWNATIYEAWAYVTAENVRHTMLKLTPIVGDALLAYAQSQGVMECSRGEAIDAIEEAQEALYGERSAVFL